MITAEVNIPNTSLLESVLSECGENANLCFQCRKCAAGCPVSFAMDHTPSEIIHAVRLGLDDIVFKSKTVWMCASCQTCNTRCPQGVDVARIMDAIKILAVKKGYKPAIPNVLSFYKAALGNIRAYGRMYELGLIINLKMRTFEFMKDAGLGSKMFFKGKLKIIPSFKGAWTTRKIFSNLDQYNRVKAVNPVKSGGH